MIELSSGQILPLMGLLPYTDELPQSSRQINWRQSAHHTNQERFFQG